MNNVNVCSDTDLSLIRRQAIILTNAGLLPIGLLWTNFKVQNFSFTEMHLKSYRREMADELTHWSLGNVRVSTFTRIFSKLIYELTSWALHSKLALGYKTPLMISQDYDTKPSPMPMLSQICRLFASLGHDELNICPGPGETITFQIISQTFAYKLHRLIRFEADLTTTQSVNQTPARRVSVLV